MCAEIAVFVLNLSDIIFLRTAPRTPAFTPPHTKVLLTLKARSLDLQQQTERAYIIKSSSDIHEAIKVPVRRIQAALPNDRLRAPHHRSFPGILKHSGQVNKYYLCTFFGFYRFGNLSGRRRLPKFGQAVGICTDTELRHMRSSLQETIIEKLLCTMQLATTQGAKARLCSQQYFLSSRRGKGRGLRFGVDE